MTTGVQNTSTGFISWCQNETANLTAPCPSENILIEVIRRVLVAVTLIIPLISLFALCLKSKEQIPPSETERMREELKKSLPEFFTLITDYQNGKTILKDQYEVAHQETLTKLGCEEAEPSTTDLFYKIQVRLNAPYPTNNQNAPFAYLFRMNNCTQLAVRISETAEETLYRVCPKYFDSGITRISSFPITQRRIVAMPSHNPIVVGPDQGNLDKVYTGQIHYGQANSLEPLVALFAYLLPQS